MSRPPGHGWRPPEDDDGPDERDSALERDEVFGGRRRLRRAIVLIGVLGIAALAFVITMMMR